jgi:hypothetical protein
MHLFLPKKSETSRKNFTLLRNVALCAFTAALVTAPVHAGTFDGPAELPRVLVQNSLASTPSKGKTWTVPAGASPQQAINTASCGDTIYLQAGATYSTGLTLPAKPCDSQHWITIRTSAPDTASPTPGHRITPCYAGVTSLPARQ